MDNLKNNKSILGLARPKDLPNAVQLIIRQIIDNACAHNFKQSIGLRLAALFDLFVSCQYYNGLANKG